MSDTRSAEEILADALPEALAVAERDGVELPPEPLAPLLEEVARHIRRYVVLSPDQATVAALWVLHTYAIDAADVTPYLIVTSPERRCGKSRLLEVLRALVPNPWYVVRPSEAVLFRKLGDGVTLFLDETDAVFSAVAKDSTEGIRATLNAGFERGATVPRCNDHGRELKDFPVFGPKVLAGIGDPPDTVKDRGFVVALRRARRSEVRERFRRRKAVPIGQALARRVAASVAPHVETLKHAEPALPDDLNDRGQDGAEPLLALADAAGGEWPEKARHALVALAGEAAEDEVDDTSGVALLRDLVLVFNRLASPKHAATEILVRELRALEASPWSKWNRGEGLDPNALARLLRPFRVRPRNLRTGDRVLKGYARCDVVEAADRYVPPVPTDPDDDPETVLGRGGATPATPLPGPSLLVENGSGGGATTAATSLPGPATPLPGPRRRTELAVAGSGSGSGSGSGRFFNTGAGSSGVAAVAATLAGSESALPEEAL